MLDLVYPVNELDGDLRKRNVARIKDDFFTCLQAPDIKQYLGTAYAVMMAATDLSDHAVPLRKTQNFESNRWLRILQGDPFVDSMYKQVAA